MVFDAGAAAHPRNPQIEKARFAQAQHYAGKVDDDRNAQRPKAFEDEEEFCGDDSIGNKIAIGDACEHLRTRQRHKYGFTLDGRCHVESAASSGADTAHNAGRSKQDEATQYNYPTMPPIETPGEHHESHGCNRDDSCDGRDRPKQRPLQPVERIDDDAGALGIGSGKCQSG